jgi:acetolactate synthase regulatory subunit
VAREGEGFVDVETIEQRNRCLCWQKLSLRVASSTGRNGALFENVVKGLRIPFVTSFYISYHRYDGVSKNFRTGRLERALQMLQLSGTRCSCIAILWVSPVSFAAITLCVASQRAFIVVYFVIDSVRKLLDTRTVWILSIRSRIHAFYPREDSPLQMILGLLTDCGKQIRASLMKISLRFSCLRLSVHCLSILFMSPLVPVLPPVLTSSSVKVLSSPVNSPSFYLDDQSERGRRYCFVQRYSGGQLPAFCLLLHHKKPET